MAARIFYQEDCNLSVLEGQTIAIIGYCWNNPVDFVDRDGNLPTVVIGAVIGLSTNGTLVDEAFARMAKKNNINVQISLDGTDRALF